SNPVTRMRATLAGPNTEYASFWETTLFGQGRPPLAKLGVVDAAQGIFDYIFPSWAAVPPDATGSYTVGMEASIELIPDNSETRLPAFSPVVAVAVTDSEPHERRVVIDNAKCNRCHLRRDGHGNRLLNTRFCPMCHNPNNSNDERAPAFEGTVGQFV